MLPVSLSQEVIMFAPFIAVPLFVILIGAVVSDWRHRLIYDWMTIPGIGYFLMVEAFFQQERVIGCLIGMAGLGGLSLLMAVVSGGQIGGGDIKLLAMMGSAIGWQAGLLVFAASYLLSGVAALCLIAAGKRHIREFPMAPFYAAGTTMVYLLPILL
jgi:leader peptidase (prepilin peptidase)/N-methyltransferase